jgi:molybdate transport system substrate-binding protein
MRRRAIAAVAAFSLAACASTEPLTVFAAASLTDAFEDLAATYTQETGVAIALSFDASSALRTQIIEGAPADLFASADTANAQQVVDAGLAVGAARPFAANALIIVAPADAGASVDSWEDLAEPRIRIVAAGEDVPITRYATDLVANLAADPEAPDGFAEAYAANVVSREDNVRAVLTKIEEGEGDAAIVYRTDALSSDGVTVIAVPEEANVATGYAFVIVDGAASEVTQFAEWLTGSDAQAILEDHGFLPAP